MGGIGVLWSPICVRKLGKPWIFTQNQTISKLGQLGVRNDFRQLPLSRGRHPLIKYNNCIDGRNDLQRKRTSVWMLWRCGRAGKDVLRQSITVHSVAVSTWMLSRCRHVASKYRGHPPQWLAGWIRQVLNALEPRWLIWLMIMNAYITACKPVSQIFWVMWNSPRNDISFFVIWCSDHFFNNLAP